MKVAFADTSEKLYMRTTLYVYYQKDDMWVGWLEEYPDYRTQGASLEELAGKPAGHSTATGNGRLPA
jgi:hypothetical protein